MPATIEQRAIRHAPWCGYLLPDGTSDQAWGWPCEEIDEILTADGKPADIYVDTAYQPQNGAVSVHLTEQIGDSSRRPQMMWHHRDPHIIREVGKAFLAAADRMENLPAPIK